MNTAEIGILIVLAMVVLQVMQNTKRIDKIGWDMTRKMDKPPEPTDWDKWKEEQSKKPFLTKEELDKVMTPEEKEARKKLYGSEYPASIK